MTWIKYDTTKHDICLEHKKDQFNDLKGNEKQIEIAKLSLKGTEFEKLPFQPWYYYKIVNKKLESCTEDDIDAVFGGNWPMHSRNM